MKFLILALTVAACVAEPVYRQGNFNFELNEPARFPNFDVNATVEGIQGFKTGLVNAVWSVGAPAVIFTFSLIAVVFAATILYQLAAAIFTGKLGLISGLFSLIVQFFSNFQSKLGGIVGGIKGDGEEDEDDVAASIRAKRNAGKAAEGQLMDMLSSVTAALKKFE